MVMFGFWTEYRAEKEARITELWEIWEGQDPKYSAGDIAKILTAVFGVECTRNAIIGKAHRLGLPRRASPIITSGESQARMTAKATATRQRRALMSDAELAEDSRQGRMDRYDAKQRYRGKPTERTKAKALALPGVVPRRVMFTGTPIRSCQFIEHEPSMTDDCKCGETKVLLGTAYCAPHYARCHRAGPAC